MLTTPVISIAIVITDVVNGSASTELRHGSGKAEPAAGMPGCSDVCLGVPGTDLQRYACVLPASHGQERDARTRRSCDLPDPTHGRRAPRL